MSGCGAAFATGTSTTVLEIACSRINPAWAAPFGGGYSHSSDTGPAVPLNARYLRATVDIGINHRGMRAVGECSNRIAIGQPESHGRPIDRRGRPSVTSTMNWFAELSTTRT